MTTIPGDIMKAAEAALNSTFVSHPYTKGDTWIPKKRALASIATALAASEARATKAEEEPTVADEPFGWTIRGDIDWLAAHPKESIRVWGAPFGNVTHPLYTRPALPNATKAEADLAEAVEALKPFAEMCECVELDFPDYVDGTIALRIRGAGITTGELRQARAIVAKHAEIAPAEAEGK